VPAIRPPRLPVLPVRRTPPVRTVVDTGAPEPATITSRGVHWVHVTRPRRANQEWLEERYRFHPLDYEDVFSRNQRPKVDRYDDYIFVVLQFPRFDRERERLNVIEVDMFVGRDYVVTLADGELEPLDSLFARCQESEEVREGYFGKGAAFLLYKIVDHCVDASFPMLRKMGQKLERLEDDIFEGRSTEIVRDLSNAKQEIINFRRIVRPQRVALRDLERAMDLTTPEELDVYFDDVIDASERIWDTLENFKEVVAALEETNESVLSHRTNDVLRVLTAASVIFLPPTLIASIFGMNVQFPLEGTEIGFWVTMAVMASSLIGTIGYFRRRGWF
jgi:magnesium transporter